MATVLITCTVTTEQGRTKSFYTKAIIRVFTYFQYPLNTLAVTDLGAAISFKNHFSNMIQKPLFQYERLTAKFAAIKLLPSPGILDVTKIFLVLGPIPK